MSDRDRQRKLLPQCQSPPQPGAYYSLLKCTQRIMETVFGHTFQKVVGNTFPLQGFLLHDFSNVTFSMKNADHEYGVINEEQERIASKPATGYERRF